MKKYLVFLVIIAIGFLVASKILAADYSITGNGTGSTSSINVNNQNSSNVVQQNSATVNNNIDVNSNTGGNSASGNNGNSTIKTGDIKTDVNIINNFNNNTNNQGCCGKLTPTPSPKSCDPGKEICNPTPTPTPSNGNGNGGNGNGGGGNGGGGSSSGGGVGGGEILGLSATAGSNDQVYVSIIGLTVISLGTWLFKKSLS